MNSFTILIVEDDAGDRELLRYAFGQSGMVVRLCEAADGEVAQAYLAGEGRYADRAAYPLPDLVLLDLKLPRKSGFEVLEWARRQAPFKTLPILVLTSSSETNDIDRAYALGANSFLVKNVDLDEMTKVVTSIGEYAEIIVRAHRSTL